MIRVLLFAMLLPTALVAQVEQGLPNADFQPAFANQTRAPALAQTPITVRRVASGLDRPWGIAGLPSGQFLITELGGTLRLMNADGTLSRPLTGVPQTTEFGQGGLMDVAVAPDFSSSRVIYLTYVKLVRGRAATAAARAVLGSDGSLTEVRDIFVQDNPSNNTRHFGSRVVPARDGTVWITTGDRGAGDGGGLAQNLTSTHGKVVRVRGDGSVPSDNPFVGRNGNDLVWSAGHRNIQGAALDGRGRLWTVEHGPRGGDELNRPQAGRNYGWPLVSYGINYNGRPIGRGRAVGNGLEPPVYYWDPVIAPSGMTFYNGGFAAWRGDAFIGSLNPGGIVRLKFSGDRVAGEERLFIHAGRVRDIEVLGDGSILVINDNGEVLQVTPG